MEQNVNESQVSAMVIVQNVIHDKKITKKSNGVNIFNAMKAQYNKNSKIDGFKLDMKNITICQTHVFLAIIEQMQKRLNGQFRLEIINANPIIINAFKAAFKI